MLLVAGKKMAGWSEVEKESGFLPAAEVAPYTWAHRFLPQEARKVSVGVNGRGKMSLPWLNLVAGGEDVTFRWISKRSSSGVRVIKDGKMSVLAHGRSSCVVARPEVEKGRH